MKEFIARGGKIKNLEKHETLHNAMSCGCNPEEEKIMTHPIFLKRVILTNYKSIAKCSVELGPLNFLVGPNGAGKSNFLDALRLGRV